MKTEHMTPGTGAALTRSVEDFNQFRQQQAAPIFELNGTEQYAVTRVKLNATKEQRAAAFQEAAPAPAGRIYPSFLEEVLAPRAKRRDVRGTVPRRHQRRDRTA